MGTVVYYYLEKDFIIKRNKIPTNTHKFSECLRMMFGIDAAFLIESIIIERLYAQIEEKLEERKECDFTEYVNIARERYLKKKRKRQ
jgi:hypothetical protein